MTKKISVVINTLNEEENIARVLNSVSWVDETIVCDMHSDDKTVEIAKKNGAKVVYHDRTGYVEPARNYAISKASNEWILILDADEEISISLKDKLLEVIKDQNTIDYISIPRKNMIFGKWIKHANWWPDYNIRFFRKGKVAWKNEIHSKPELVGSGTKLNAEEDLAIIHHHYTSTSQFISRMNRYTDIQAEELVKSGYKFDWRDIIIKPLNEFLGRYFANQGYKDGFHGLSLSLLQSFSFLIMYLKVWEKESFKEMNIPPKEMLDVINKSGKDINYWLEYSGFKKSIKDLLKKFL